MTLSNFGILELVSIRLCQFPKDGANPGIFVGGGIISEAALKLRKNEILEESILIACSDVMFISLEIGRTIYVYINSCFLGIAEGCFSFFLLLLAT